MKSYSEIAIVLIVGVILLRAMATGTDAYSAFLRGAGRGMRSAAGLLPAMCGMTMMMAVMDASGLTELLTRAAAPVMRLIQLPEELTPLILLRPLTGSGSLAALEQLLRECGPDSRTGRLAAVIMGSGETVLYTMTVYAGAAGIRKLPGVLCASLAGYAVSVAVCSLII